MPPTARSRLRNNSSVRLQHRRRSPLMAAAPARRRRVRQTVVLTNSTVSGNIACADADNATKGSGGGIHATGSATLTNSTVSGNRTAGDGGGIFCRGTATLTNSTVSGNTAVDQRRRHRRHHGDPDRQHGQRQHRRRLGRRHLRASRP